MQDSRPILSMERLCVDLVAQTITLNLSDRRSISAPLPPGLLVGNSSAARLWWEPSKALLQVETIRGEHLQMDLPGTPATGCKPVIYLDQNHWSTVAKVRYAPHRVPALEAGAARALINLAEAGAVMLPLSGGHLTETGQWTSADSRYELALTMLSLSRGWRMRNPLDLRLAEIRAMIAERFRLSVAPRPRDVFTVDPNGLFAESLLPSTARRESRGSSTDRDYFVEALGSACALVDAMLDSEPTVPGDVSSWVAKMQRVTNELSIKALTREERRLRVNSVFFIDLWAEFTSELVAAGVVPEEWDTWLCGDSDCDVAAMPVLGLYREVLREKLSNPATTWESNDLVDVLYLTSAVAHADYVAGENSMTAALEGGLRRLGRPKNVHRTLRSLVAELER